jgi:uncharacterized protein YybS (DUF2232 family)
MRTDIVTGVLITCLLVAACALVPIVGMMGTVFIPVPVLFYHARTGRQAAVVIAAATLGFVSLLGGALELVFFGEFLLIGLALGELMPRGVSIERTAGVVCAAVFAFGLAGLAVYGVFTGAEFFAILSETARVNLELTVEIYRQMGVSEEQIQFLENALPVIQRVLIGIVPALAVSSTLMVIWASLLTARAVFQRFGMPFADYGELDHWKAPEPLVWGVIAAGGLLLVPDFFARTVGLNGLLVFMVVYFFQGIAIVAFYFRKKKVPRVARLLFYGIVGVQQVVMLAVIGVGFFDTWFNFRKLGKPIASH